MRGVFEPVSRIGIYGKQNLGKFFAHRRDVVDIFSALDFQLDPLIAAPQLFFHFPGQRLRALANAERHSAGNFIQSAAQQLREWNSFKMGLRIPKRILHAALRHLMTTNCGQRRGALRSGRNRLSNQRGRNKI